MTQFQEKAIITRFEELSDDIIRITLHSPEIASKTKPGQFVMVRTSSSKDPLLRRPFSVHQTSSNGDLQLLFKVVGRGTTLLSRFKEGEAVSVFGPLGNGYSIKEGRPSVLVGGGLGIAPMLLLAKEISRVKKDPSNDVIIIGGRSSGEVAPLLNDFKEFGIKVIAVTDDGSFGQQGFVTDAMKSIKLHPDSVVYTCGPEPMMEAVKNICSAENMDCQVSVESVMARGMGACLGCTTHSSDGNYVHVCLDGPVFKAEDLKWSL